MNNTNQDTGQTPWDLVLRILNNPRLLIISLLILGAATFIYVKCILPGSVKDTRPVCNQWTLSGRLISNSDEFLNLKGIKVGVESGPFSDDDRITDGIFRITGFTLPKDNFIELYLEGNSKVLLFYRRPFDTSKITIDRNSCVLLFQEDLTVPDDVLKQVKPPDTPAIHHDNIGLVDKPKPLHTFSINLPDPSIIQDIVKNTGYKYDPSSPTNKILVTYDATQMVSAGPETYTFISSSPIVQIDNRKFKLSDCLIPAPAFPSHDKQKILDMVSDQSDSVVIPYLKKHPNLIAQWITGSKP